MFTARVRLVALAALAAVGLTACSSNTEKIGDAVDQVHTAGASVSIASELNTGGGLPATSLDTSIVDALTEIGDAESTLTELQPATAEVASRDEALARIRNVEDAVLDLQAALANGGDLGQGRDDLEAALTELEQ